MTAAGWQRFWVRRAAIAWVRERLTLLDYTPTLYGHRAGTWEHEIEAARCWALGRLAA